ncbi:hypothetical protein DFH29DRAFT_884139, partial [Suillus ampliporus]
MEENGLEILQEIMECGILNSSPHRKIAARPVKYTAPDTGDAGHRELWNIGQGKEILTDNKRLRGRPKKKVIKRTGNRSTKKQACAKDGLKSSARPIIHATISPVPEDPPTDGNVVEVNHSNGKATGNHKEVSVMVSPIQGRAKAGCGHDQNSGATEDTELMKLQTKQKGRGRPKKHVVGSRLTASDNKVLNMVADAHDHGTGESTKKNSSWMVNQPLTLRHTSLVAIFRMTPCTSMGPTRTTGRRGGGPRYWRMLQRYTDGRVQDWAQNGVDCGPIACSGLEQALTCGPGQIWECAADTHKIDYMMLLDGPQTHWIAHEIPHEDVIFCDTAREAIGRMPGSAGATGCFKAQYAQIADTLCSSRILETAFTPSMNHNVPPMTMIIQFEDEEVVEQCRSIERYHRTQQQKAQTRPVLRRLRRDHRQKPGRHPVIRVTISPVPGAQHIWNLIAGRGRAVPKDDLDVTMGSRLKKHTRVRNTSRNHSVSVVSLLFAAYGVHHYRREQYKMMITDLPPPPLPEVPLNQRLWKLLITGRAMARPVCVDFCLAQLENPWLNERLEATVANFYLLHVWYEALSRSRLRYVDLCVVMANNMADEDMELFRRNHFVPHEGACPVVPVGFIVHDSECFFAVILDFQKRTAHVLGRQMSDGAIDVDGADPHDWSNWRGPEYWRKIAALHDWSPGDVTDVSVIPRDSTKTGVDCGPMACSVLEQCMISGVDERGNLPPFQVQCGHKLRIHMLRMVAGCIKMS